MIYVERKTKEGYIYTAENVVGKLEVQSTKKLSGETLDDVLLLLLRNNLTAKTVKGEVTQDGDVISYTLERASQWEESSGNEQWNDTPISTKEPVSESTVKPGLKIQILRLLQKSVVVLRALFRKRRPHTGDRSETGDINN